MTGRDGITAHALAADLLSKRSGARPTSSSASRATASRSGRRGEQLLVGAELDDAAAVEHDDLVGVADRREPVRDRDRRPALREPSSASCTGRSVCVSSAEVASSRTRTGGLRRIVRAIAIRCFSPPEKR